MTDEEYDKESRENDIKSSRVTLGDTSAPAVVLLVRNVSRDESIKLLRGVRAAMPDVLVTAVDEQRDGVSFMEMHERCAARSLSQSDIDEQIAWAKSILIENGIALPQAQQPATLGA